MENRNNVTPAGHSSSNGHVIGGDGTTGQSPWGYMDNRTNTLRWLTFEGQHGSFIWAAAHGDQVENLKISEHGEAMCFLLTYARQLTGQDTEELDSLLLTLTAGELLVPCMSESSCLSQLQARTTISAAVRQLILFKGRERLRYYTVGPKDYQSALTIPLEENGLKDLGLPSTADEWAAQGATPGYHPSYENSIHILRWLVTRHPGRKLKDLRTKLFLNMYLAFSKRTATTDELEWLTTQIQRVLQINLEFSMSDISKISKAYGSRIKLSNIQFLQTWIDQLPRNALSLRILLQMPKSQQTIASVVSKPNN